MYLLLVQYISRNRNIEGQANILTIVYVWSSNYYLSLSIFQTVKTHLAVALFWSCTLSILKSKSLTHVSPEQLSSSCWPVNQTSEASVPVGLPRAWVCWRKWMQGQAMLLGAWGCCNTHRNFTGCTPSPPPKKKKERKKNDRKGGNPYRPKVR